MTISTEQRATRAWRELLCIRRIGQPVAAGIVTAVDEVSVSFRVPGCAAPPLRVGCRPAGQGPAFQTTRLFGIYYFGAAGRTLFPIEQRFLQLLCELTRRLEATRPDDQGQ